MFVQVPMLTGYGGVSRVEVSVPYVSALIGEKYYMEPKRLEGTELRRHRSRGPTLRSLVKLALKCDSAEQMGKQLKWRFDRSLSRQGNGCASARNEAEPRKADRGTGLTRLLVLLLHPGTGEQMHGVEKQVPRGGNARPPFTADAAAQHPPPISRTPRLLARLVYALAAKAASCSLLGWGFDVAISI